MKMANLSRSLLGVAWMAAAATYPAAAETAKPQSPAQLRAASFRKGDLNQDGFITRDEFAESNHLRAAAPTSDRDIRATRIMGTFQDMDKNGDGRVSGKEYIRFMEKNGG